MILDDMEANPDKYKDKKLTELTDDEDFDEENSVEYTQAYHKKTLLPKIILVILLVWTYIDLFVKSTHFIKLIFDCRKQASRNLTWRLLLLNVRLITPLIT